MTRCLLLLVLWLATAMGSTAASLDSLMTQYGLVDVGALDSAITVDLRYATTNNFVGRQMYGSLTRAYLTPETARSLLVALAMLRTVDTRYGFIIYDAARPLSVQRTMWDCVKGTPNERYVAKPHRGGPHNYGMAVDIALTLDGVPLDMGTPFDTFTPAAHITAEPSLVKRGIISREAMNNRRLLRRVMTAAGFGTFSREWWHFTRYKMPYTRAHLPLLDF